MIINLNERLILHTEGNKCYTRLSIGSEESGNSEIYIIHLYDKELVRFRFHLLWHYRPAKSGLEEFDLIITDINITDLPSLLKTEFYNLIIENYKKEKSDIRIEIIEEFINYISKEDNGKYIIYKI